MAKKPGINRGRGLGGKKLSPLSNNNQRRKLIREGKLRGGVGNTKSGE
jgi:hypothetical protein